MKTSTAEKLYDKLLNEYISDEGEVKNEVVEFLEAVGELTKIRRLVLMNKLKDLGIDTLEDLEQEILKQGPNLIQPPTPKHNLKPLDEKKKKPKTRLLPGNKIDTLNVWALIQKYKDLPAIKQLLEMKTKDQVKAFHQAGIKFVGQLDVTDELQMQRLKNSAASAISGITPEKGKRNREILTPTGSGKNR